MAQQSNQLSLTRRLAGWVGRKALGYSVNQKLTDHDFVSLFTGGTTSAGIRVGADDAMRVTAVWSCIRVLSETIGSLPWAIYEKDSKGNARKVDHDLGAVLINSPNAQMTSQEMREALMVNLNMVGNGYAILERGATTGRVLAVTPVVSSHMTPAQKPTGELVYKYRPGGSAKEEELPADRVWHLKGFGNNGLVGLSPLGHARQAFAIALATEEFGARFFKQGAKTTGIIKVPDWLTDKQRLQAKEIVKDFWHGLTNAHKVQVLEGGMSYENPTMPLEDAQFLQTRKFQIAEICRIYRVPPHMVADLDRSTFSNIEQQSQDFVQFTLLPYFKRFEETFSKLFLKPGERGRFFLRFNYEGLLRADSTARAQFYNTMLQNGVFNRNEVRSLENLPRAEAPGMDDYTVQQNMALIQLLEAMARSNQAEGQRA